MRLCALTLVCWLTACVGTDAAVDGDTDACACADDTCRDTWVRENVGCDLCVALDCADGAHHTCVACEVSPDATPLAALE